MCIHIFSPLSLILVEYKIISFFFPHHVRYKCEMWFVYSIVCSRKWLWQPEPESQECNPQYFSLFLMIVLHCTLRYVFTLFFRKYFGSTRGISHTIPSQYNYWRIGCKPFKFIWLRTSSSSAGGPSCTEQTPRLHNRLGTSYSAK